MYLLQHVEDNQYYLDKFEHLKQNQHVAEKSQNAPGPSEADQKKVYCYGTLRFRSYQGVEVRLTPLKVCMVFKQLRCLTRDLTT